ncbi:MAG: PQQ-dependent sugar dehydrogenase [Alphaproteobacteria bacterium]
MLVLTLFAAPPLRAQIETVRTRTGPVAVETVAGGLVHPWGVAFLPDGRLLITERPGRLRILGTDGRLSGPLTGVPQVFAQGQGGLLDVALDPEFAQNRLVYLSYAEPGPGGASTALGRGVLADNRIDGFQVIFRQEPKVSGSAHFGSRIVFAPDGTLFLALGERFKFDPSQDLSSGLGKVMRLNRDGSIPRDNPFVGRPNAQAAIWSYGHRNIQAAAINPQSGALWVAEMGPRGGDELNLPERGRNYGWPLVSWGNHYDGRPIPNPPTRPEFADAIKHWTPAIAPSGMIFYTENTFPEWRGNVLIGSLTQQALVRLAIQGSQVASEEIIPLNARIRDVAQGPDGAVYLLTDQQNGAVLRLRPQR